MRAPITAVDDPGCVDPEQTLGSNIFFGTGTGLRAFRPTSRSVAIEVCSRENAWAGAETSRAPCETSCSACSSSSEILSTIRSFARLESSVYFESSSSE